MRHGTAHPLAGKTVALDPRGVSPQLAKGVPFVVEDWADRVIGGSWTVTPNMAAMNYAMRVMSAALPMNDEVVYGKIGGSGHIVHVVELGDLVASEATS